MSTRFLILGEIVGRAGIQCIKNGLDALKKEYNIDYTIANAEGTTNGFGLGKAHSLQLNKMGINILTTGEKSFYKIDMVEFFPKASFALRPANYPSRSPGRGIKYVEIKDKKVGILNLMGNSNFSRINIQNAFLAAEGLIKDMKTKSDYIIVQFHSATTAEIQSMSHYLDGDVATVIGTHNKVITNDARITEKGTALITDNGRVGSYMSVSGFNPEAEIEKLLTSMPQRSHEAWECGMIQGVVVEVDDCGKASNIIPIMKEVKITKPEVKE